jgi:DNA-binding NarL/FixJ family response regulator
MSEILPFSNHQIKVLIVDDSLVVRERLVAILDELAGIEIVGQAENVTEAIGAVRKLRPDVIILDIWMPGGSGIDVLRQIKQGGAGPMVIILTNYPFPEYRQRCLNAGANFFLDKSTEFDQIPKLFKEFRQTLSSGY